jgi:hypothetical protein
LIRQRLRGAEIERTLINGAAGDGADDAF